MQSRCSIDVVYYLPVAFLDLSCGAGWVGGWVGVENEINANSAFN